MRRLVPCLFVMIAALLFSHAGFAQEAAEAVDKATATLPEAPATLSEDIRNAKELLMGKGGDSVFARGFLVALFQPVFLASMFCLGLWAGQMSERVKNIWVLPVFVLVATLVGSFIATYHTEWMPKVDGDAPKLIASLQSTDAVAVVVGLLVGGAVAMQMIVAPIFAVLGAIVAGLALGFSQTTEMGEHHNSLMLFWSGFGLMGLLVNIFGIGFETFLQSIKLPALTRAVGFATAIAAFFFGSKIF